MDPDSVQIALQYLNREFAGLIPWQAGLFMLCTGLMVGFVVGRVFYNNSMHQQIETLRGHWISVLDIERKDNIRREREKDKILGVLSEELKAMRKSMGGTNG